ncbi:MAG: type I restriction enzyme HsdR N-terminal domain-containing protein [Flavicella sp.]
MTALNLPPYNYKIKSSENKRFIFDPLRKKFIILTPEEWVRQHFVNYLTHFKNYPVSLIAIEKQLTVNDLKKRTDILIFDRYGKPNIIVECKAPKVNIDQNTFDQIARYNLKLCANYLVVTNGIHHYYCKMDFENERYVFLENIPNYS